MFVNFSGLLEDLHMNNMFKNDQIKKEEAEILTWFYF